MDKNLSLEEAANMVKSGDRLALGGMTLYRRPVGFVRALLKKYLRDEEPKDLTLISFTAGFECDLLVGMGMVSKIRTCYFGLEIFGLAPMFTYYANRGLVEVCEETEASIALGLRAQMAGIGFMPGRGWIGTDLPKLRPDVKTVLDPYSGEELMAYPAIQPDVSVIHALQADTHGNAIIGNNKGIDEELPIASKMVIITTEKLIPELKKCDLVSPFTHAVALAPNGALPSSCHPLYPLDGEMILSYAESVSDPDTFDNFIHKWLK